MEVYAGFLAYTDFEIGRLIEVIRARPDGDSTLIFYIVGDNGSSAEGGIHGAEDAAEVFRGHEVPLEAQLPAMDELGGPRHPRNHYAAGWGWMGATPLQWSKQVASHFGGTTNPLIVSWPAGIKDQGTVRLQFTHVVDIAPTIYDLTGIRTPRRVDGVAQLTIDGVSFAQSFDRPDGASHHRVQYFETMGNRAIYRDGWVAAARHSIPWIWTQSEDFSQDRWELYDVSTDFSQAMDMADADPKRLRALKALFEREALRNHVFPLTSGAFKH